MESMELGMPGILKIWLDPWELPAKLKELREISYRRGSWQFITGTSKIEVKAWRIVKELKAERKFPRQYLVAPAQMSKRKHP
jgi:hypothetical protein